MTEPGHDYLDDDTTSENVGHWLTVRARCSCGWRADGYHLEPKAAGLHQGHVWEMWDTRTRIADIEERERRVETGELCPICEENPNEQTLCGTKHCMRQGCVQACRFCMDDLRDERE